MAEKPYVIIVDDTPAVLRLLTHVVHSVVDCEVVTFPEPRAAIGFLHDHSAACVISDYHMPGMDGGQFLGIINEQYPQIVRIAVSGSEGALANMQLAGSAHQFFRKPDDTRKLALRIERMFRLRASLPSHGLDHLVARVKTLPTPPAIFAELEALLATGDASADEVGRILERDIAMSAKVLQLCNSAFFGFREKVTRPRHAVALLGINMVRSLTLALHAFTKWANNVPRFNHDALLAHSLNVASLSQDIAEMEGVQPENLEVFFISGLLHDIGKLVFAANASDTYNKVFEIVDCEGKSFVDAERDILGATHAEAGAYLLGLWGFDDDIVTAAAYHHLPSLSGDRRFAALTAVHVANALEHQKMGEKRLIDPDFLRRLDLVDRLDVWRSPKSVEPLTLHP